MSMQNLRSYANLIKNKNTKIVMIMEDEDSISISSKEDPKADDQQSVNIGE